ncbi:GIY-YIG nuclease family protein [Stieleria varia]|uniref:UvrABC system protein C n=1 Tax=Stieleria varia TaxID=2528005 RepID=A0A5C6A395_9BACT|nr:GIY-YIG nuclease family protein [Stieleria varia]TWT93876.1 UvrABC system protein C [Stieleria varia]
MDALYDKQPEFGFGINPLNPHGSRPIEIVGARDRETLRNAIVQSCPRVPGVYGMLDRSGSLIYVGKSKSLRSRLLSYFAASNEDEKGGRIIENARAIQWETQPSDFAALLREQQLIRQFTPRWNVQGIPNRQRPVYLCLGRKVPQFFLAAVPPEECIAVEGPFHGAGRMRAAVDTLNKVFRLRDCSQKQVFRFAEQLQLFEVDYRPGCLRYEVGTCSGPCVAACTRAQYDEQVNAAQSFLDGFNDEPLVAIQDQIDVASANRQYELAGRAHRTLKAVSYVHRKLTMLASARNKYNFIYSVPGYDGCGTWYLIHCGEVAAVAAAPRDANDYKRMKPLLAQWSATLTSSIQRGHGPFPQTLSIVASWYRKQKDELGRTFAPEQAGHKYHRQSHVA